VAALKQGQVNLDDPAVALMEQEEDDLVKHLESF
jgi:hypothetical protein